MTDVDTSILDELRGRNRRAALRQRGASTGRVKVSAPRPLGRRKPKPRVRPKGPGINSQTAKANARASIAARREREGDVIADALLGICSRLAQERGVA